MQLYEHQRKILKDNPLKAGLFLGTGSGKTRIALLLAQGKTLVIAPKTQKLDRNWEREKEKLSIDIDLTVISKEEFRRDVDTLGSYETVICDEAHTLLGVTPNTRQKNKQTIPKTSQLFEALDWYCKHHAPTRIYLVTATITKSPMTVWGAAHILGKEWNFYDFRDIYYTRLPMPGREVWVAKSTEAIKERLAQTVHKLGYVGRLQDYFDVPEQTYRDVFVDTTTEQERRIKSLCLEYPDPIVLTGKAHQIENGTLKGDEFSCDEEIEDNKIDKIVEFAEEFPKMIIFAKYSLQIEKMRRTLDSKKYTVFTLTGATQNTRFVLDMMSKVKQGILIVQSQISAGWELPDVPVMIFASMSYSVVDRVQAEGRILRSNALKKNLYITLITKGGVDEAVYKCIQNKQDFNEKLFTIKAQA